MEGEGIPLWKQNSGGMGSAQDPGMVPAPSQVPTSPSLEGNGGKVASLGLKNISILFA